jgi:hypothetical protein
MISHATLRARTAFHRLAAEIVRRPRIVLILIWIVALVPMVHLTSLVRHYGVNVPMLDDWEMAPLIVKAQTGELTWADFFQQQQEARTILPKLIFVLSGARGEWDVRDQMMLSVGSCWLTAAGIFLLLRRSGLGIAGIAVCFWLAVLTIFSLAQYELWILASGFPSFLPGLFLVVALVTLTTSWPTSWKFLVCLALAVASSFTLANGLLAWGLTFPMLLLMERIVRWRWWLALWLGACAICATIYFWGYKSPGYLPPFAPAVSPVKYLHFILIFLGSGVANSVTANRAAVSPIFGGLNLLIFLGALVYAARRVRDRAFFARIIPWVALGFYALASACLASLGRIGFGAEYAGASRYVTFAHYMTVAVIVIVALISREIWPAGHFARRRIWLYLTWLVLAAAYLVPYRAAQANSLYFLRRYSAETRLARGAVLFSPAFDTSHVIEKIAYPPGADRVVRDAAALDRLHLLRPPLLRTNHLSAMPHETADQTHVSGFCETVTLVGGDVYRASGWSTLNGPGRPADCVVVAYQDPRDQEWVAFGISDSIERRLDIVKRFRSMDQFWSGWTATFSLGKIPAGARLSFWAVDAGEPKLYQLGDQSSTNHP